MHNIFKTELRNCASNPNFKNKLPLTTKNRNKKIIINNLLSRKDLNKKILNNSLNKKLLSGSYLNFMIQEKLAYADVDKIIDHYSKKIDEYKKKYDENQNIILKKKQELYNLNMDLYTNLVKNYKFEESHIEDDEKQREEIEKTKKEVKAKEHQIEIFKDLYNQTYKLNLKLSNKFFMENNFSKIYQEQYDKYNNIYTNSIHKIQKQEEKLNVLNGYFYKYKTINNSLLSEKVNKLNQLEYEIVLIKNNVTEFEENLAKIKEKYEQIQKFIEPAKQGYLIRANDYSGIKKQYLKEYYKMFEIYEIFKVDDIDKILKQFILKKKKNISLSMKYNKNTNEIFNLRIQLTNLEKKIKETKLEAKKRKAQIKFENEKSNRDLLEIINMQKNSFNLSSIELFSECINKENLISFGLNYLIEMNKKIIFSLNNSFNKSPLLAKKKFASERKSKLLVNIYNIKSISTIPEKNLIITIINILKFSTSKIYEIIQNILYNIYLPILEKENEQENEDQKFKIIKYDSEIVEKMFDLQLKQIKEKLRVKKQIYSRNKDNLIFSPSDKNLNISLNKKRRSSFSSENLFNIKKNKILIKRYKSISRKDLFNEYCKYNSNNPLFSGDFSGINKKLFIDEYSNEELVADEDIEKIKSERLKRIKEASMEIKYKLEDKELKKFIMNKENKLRIIQLRKNIKEKKLDEQGEDELKDYENELMLLKKELSESKKRKKFKVKLANPENNLIINRNEELRKFEFNYIKNYSDYRVEQNIFNEYFYNVRKKFRDIDKNPLYDSINNNNQTSKRLPKNIKIKKNFSILLPKIDNKNM